MPHETPPFLFSSHSSTLALVLSTGALTAIDLISALTQVIDAKHFKRQMQVCEKLFLRSKSIKGKMRRCSDECNEYMFFHPGLSELEGSGSQLSYILPQQCLQLNRQIQEAVLWRHYDEIGKETEVLLDEKDTGG